MSAAKRFTPEEARKRRDEMRALVRRDSDRPQLTGSTLRLLADDVDAVSDEVFARGSSSTAYSTAEELRIIAEDVDLRPFSGSVAQAITIRAELAEKARDVALSDLAAQKKESARWLKDAQESLERARHAEHLTITARAELAAERIVEMVKINAAHNRLLGVIASLLAQIPATDDNAPVADVVLRTATNGKSPGQPALTIDEWHTIAVQIANLRAQGSQPGAGGDEKLR